MRMLLTMHRRTMYLTFPPPSLRFHGQRMWVESRLRGSRKNTTDVYLMITDMGRLLLVFNADWHRKRRIIHFWFRSKSFVQIKTFYANDISKSTDAWWVERMKYVCNEYTTDAKRFCTDGKIFFTFCILFASASAVGPGLIGQKFWAA